MAEESSQGSPPRGSPHSYPQKVSKATPAFQESNSPLIEKIRAAIANQGPLPFRDFMAMVLYDPEYGYYTARAQRVGKTGDFITSVSVGRCFGLILAHRLISYWEEIGQPSEFHLIEPGGHDGALCADILLEIRNSAPKFFEGVHYHLIETTPSLIKEQQLRLGKQFAGKFTSHCSISELSGLTGAILSNELVDAFPVDLIKFEHGKWWQLKVEEKNDTLQFVNTECDDDQLCDFCASLGDQFPDGYTTEYNPGIGVFVKEASAALASGLFITIDYGHESVDYYHPDRTNGTLQTYHKHQKSDDPLCFPGEIDITSHVDFTRLISAAEAEGFTHPSLKTQASYLTNHARDWLISLETAPTAEFPALLRQFQTLTHPAMLGSKFMVLEMQKR